LGVETGQVVFVQKLALLVSTDRHVRGWTGA
jgi:hypothetical protein